MTASDGTPFTTLIRHREPGAAGRGDPAGFQLVDCFVAALLAMTEIVSGNYYVYILTNRRNGTLYTGITNSLERRVWQHQNKTAPGFTAKYGLGRLVYFEQFIDVSNAIAREKQIKAGSRAKKVAFIEKENPEWKDLSAGWY
jgi:putative endonuclease